MIPNYKYFINNKNKIKTNQEKLKLMHKRSLISLKNISNWDISGCQLCWRANLFILYVFKTRFVSVEEKKMDAYNCVSLSQSVYHSSEEILWTNDAVKAKYQQKQSISKFPIEKQSLCDVKTSKFFFQNDWCF